MLHRDWNSGVLIPALPPSPLQSLLRLLKSQGEICAWGASGSWEHLATSVNYPVCDSVPRANGLSIGPEAWARKGTRSKRLLVDEREPQAGASGPGFQSQLDHSCVILSRSPPLLEPHLFSSNVEQPGSRGPSSAVSYAAGTEEGGNGDHLGRRAGSRTEPAQVPGSVFWTARVEAVQALGSGSGLARWVGGCLQVPCPLGFVHSGLTALRVCQGMA